MEEAATLDSSNVANWPGFSFRIPESVEARFQSADAMGLVNCARFEWVARFVRVWSC